MIVRRKKTALFILSAVVVIYTAMWTLRYITTSQAKSTSQAKTTSQAMTTSQPKTTSQAKTTSSAMTTSYAIGVLVKEALQYSWMFENFEQLPYFTNSRSVHANDVLRKKYVVETVGKLTHEVQKSNHEQNSKLILYYNIPMWIQGYYMPFCSIGVSKCPIRSCRCSKDPNELSEASGVIIDGATLNIPLPPKRYPNQVWIFHGLEPPSLYSPTFRSKDWQNVFNWTMTYRLDSDVFAPYDVIVRRGVQSVQNFTGMALRKPKAALWLVSDCRTQSQREGYVRELTKHYKVDILGECGPQRTRAPGLNILQKDYRFYLSFENSLCDDYVTEKLFLIYRRNIALVPVVRGRGNYSALLPAGTYINTADFSSPRHLAQHLNYLDRNVTAYAEMLRLKDEYVSVGPLGKLSLSFCDLCIKLHNLEKFSNEYGNISQWIEKGVCHKPADY